MKKHCAAFSLDKLSLLIKTPIAITLVILMVGMVLVFGMYAVIQDSFFKVTASHEVDVMEIVRGLGIQAVDAKLAAMKSYCAGMLMSVEVELIREDRAGSEEALRKIPLPEDGLNLAYWNDGALICKDDSFKAELAQLDFSELVELDGAVIINPDLDESGRYILTVAASDRARSEVFVAQYDGYCISSWLSATISIHEQGTAYIVDNEGYNIATAKEENFDWITTRYNSLQLAAQDPNRQNVSIATLEKKALDGEVGYGVYEWEGNLSHLIYGPLTEVPWGYYVGFYQTEFELYARDVTRVSGRSTIVLLAAFGSFMGLIVGLLFRSLTRERKYTHEILLQKAEAERRNREDPLTKVHNKLAWQEAIEQLDGEIKSGAARFALVVCDVNGLKRVNDSLGHEAGDALIVRASTYIKRSFPNSPVYRIGGDEFAVILKNADLLDCDKLFDAFYKGLPEADLNDPEAPALSIAMGASLCQLGDISSSEVFHKADSAMYRNKFAEKR